MGRNLYAHPLDNAAWWVLPAGYDTNQLDHKGWDDPVLTDHGIYLVSDDPDAILVGSRTTLRNWLIAVLAQVEALPPDVCHADGTLTAQAVASA